MKVEIYSDIACPWCYIGKRRFEGALDTSPLAGEIEVVWRPFQLNPGAPATAVPLLQALEKKFGLQAPAMMQRVAQAGQEEGLQMDWDKALSVNTFQAHRLLDLALREAGPEAQHAVAELLFDGYFSRGADLGDPETLADIAAQAGLDRDRVSRFLASEEGTEEVRAAIDRARRLGITAVPTFVFEDHYAVSGAQPAAVFRQVLESVARELEGAHTHGEDCTDGACAV